MNAADYLKRAFSSVFHEDKVFRSIIASLATAGSLVAGYVSTVYEETSPQAPVSIPEEQAALKSYLTEIQALRTPPVADVGWKNFDQSLKGFSEKVLLDTRLSEAGVQKVMSEFKGSVRVKPPEYLWLSDTRNGDGEAVVPAMNYLDECKASISASSAGRAQEVYACATGKETANALWTGVPAVIGGIGGLFFLLIGGGILGERWEREFDQKKRKEGWEKTRRQREENPSPSLALRLAGDSVRMCLPSPEAVRQEAAEEKPLEKKIKPALKIKFD